MPTLAVMAETGFIELFLAGVPQLANAARMIEAETAAELAPDPVRRLAALAVLVAEDAERLTQRLRLFNVERERLESMADRWWHVTPALGEAGARVLLASTRARKGDEDARWREMVSLPARWPVPRFPLRSADLMDRGVPRGPALGAALRAAEDAWIAAGFPLDASALDAIADAAAQGSMTGG
jgi:poly(A) polymerase